MGSMGVEAQVRLDFGSSEGVQQRYPVGYPWSRRCCSRNREVGKGWRWNLVDLGIRSARLTPMTISGLVLHTHPLAPSLPTSRFWLYP